MIVPDPETQSSELSKPSGLRRVFKWLAIAGALVLLLLLCLTLLLTYWFPSELVRQELEVRLSDMLEGSVRIQDLSFNLLTGLSLQQVEFQQAGQPMIELDRLILDYSLFGLFQQKLKINEIRIDGADLFLDLPGLQSASPSSPPAAPSPPSQAGSLPPIPLTVDLEALVISRTNIDVVVFPDVVARLRDLNLEVAGGVTQDAARLKGDLTVSQVGLDLEGKQLRFPLGLVLDVEADLAAPHLSLNDVTLSSEPTLTLTLSGSVDDFLGSPTLELSLDRSHLDLKQIVALVRDFIPEEFREVTLSGIVSPTLSVRGSLGAHEFTGTIHTHSTFQDVQTDLPQFEAKLESTDVEIHLTDVVVKDNMPDAGTVEIHVQSEKAAFQTYDVGGLDFQVAGDYFALGPVSATMKISGIAHVPPQGSVDALMLPFDVRLDARGNYRTQDATIKQLDVELGELMDVSITGTINPNPAKTMNVDFKTRLEPHLEYILPLIPRNLLPNLEIEKISAPDFLTVDIQGTLDAQHRPIQMDASARWNVGNVTIKENALSAGGTLESMNFSLSTQYNAGREDIRGTLAGTMNLAGLGYENMAAVGHVRMALDTTFRGRLSPMFEVSQLGAEQAMNLLVKDIQYASPDLGMGLEEVSISTTLQENLDSQHYRVKALRVTSEGLMDVQLSADFQQKTNEFKVVMNIPYVNIGELQRKFSGQAVQGLRALHSGGELALAVKASGRVPQKDEIKTLDLPVTVDSTLSLDNVHAAYGDYQVKGVKGSLDFSLAPGDRPEVKVKTDVTVPELVLGPGLPLERVSETYATLDVLTKNFDDVDVKTLRVGMRGVDVSLEGSIGGLRDMIEAKKDVKAILPDVFAQVETSARLSLDEFQQVLRPQGLLGSGQADLSLSLLKKERGPLSFRLELGSRDVNVSQDGTRIKKVQGQISIRKQLEWRDHRSGTRLKGRFRPSDILSQLRSIKGKERSLAIDRLEVGGLTISDFTANIVFDQDSFKIQNVAMNLLDGGLGGNIIVRGGKAFGVAGRFEAAQLDLNQLLVDQRKISGDSRVDATIGFSVFFEEDTGVLDLSRTEMRLFVTHIGAEAVDRLLVFLDPEGSNPTLVSARSQIKLANPSNVALQLSRGMLSLKIQFSEGVLPTFELKRIPVGKIKQFKAVTEAIPAWENVRAIMDIMGAKTYGIDNQGTLVIQ